MDLLFAQFDEIFSILKADAFHNLILFYDIWISVVWFSL